MCKNKKFRLNAAALFIVALSPVFALAGAACPSAIDGLMYTAGPANFVEVSAVAANPPAVVPVAAIEKAGPAAPQPGKDLSPVVKDQKRIKAILKLVADIYNGVHLPYSQDGAIFSNKEKGLPEKPRGFYKEYTLLTGDAPHTVTIGQTTYQVAPDLSARGSERLIIGGGEKVYYTPDHYKSYVELTMVY